MKEMFLNDLMKVLKNEMEMEEVVNKVVECAHKLEKHIQEEEKVSLNEEQLECFAMMHDFLTTFASDKLMERAIFYAAVRTAIECKEN